MKALPVVSFARARRPTPPPSPPVSVCVRNTRCLQLYLEKRRAARRHGAKLLLKCASVLSASERARQPYRALSWTTSAARLTSFGLRRCPTRARRLVQLLASRLRADLEARDLLRRQKTVRAGPQPFVAQMSDGHAPKLQDRVAYQIKHASDLLIAPFVKHDLEPGVRTGLVQFFNLSR